MPNTLSKGEQIDLAKLSKLMGVTTSKYDAGALTALRHANRLLSDAKLTWSEVLESLALPAPEPEPRQQQRSSYRSADPSVWPMNWRDGVRFCSTYSYLLNQKSREFVAQLTYYTHRPSDPQLAWLQNCVERLLAKGLRP